MSDFKPINPEIIEDEKFIDMPVGAQLLFAFIVAASDDEGCTEYNKVAESHISLSEHIDELIQNNFISKIYEDEAATIVYINRWHELNADIVEAGERSMWHKYIPLN